MARAKSRSKDPGHCCRACGRVHGQWVGRCEGCGEWGTVEEVAATSGVAAPGARAGAAVRPVALTDVDAGSDAEIRLHSGIGELDRVMGGGIVRGSLTLLGGEPGIGKSTLLLRLAANLARTGKRVLYVCGEESPRQIRLRADRIGAVAEGLELLPAVEVERILAELEERPPDLMLIDSVQTLVAPGAAGIPGSPSQLSAVATTLLNAVKGLELPCILVAHVNKEGDIAGPKLLEHMVDVVLYFEGDRDQGLRFLRTVKNRFGPSGELGVFAMEEDGLQEISNPSALFFSETDLELPGSCVAAGIEGSRCYLVEVQALVSPAVHAYPRRVAQGWEHGRLTVLTSVLERRLGVPLSREDVCVKVIGGIQLKEPAMDLALAMAILSSRRDEPLPPRRAFAGEVGLGGEIRAIGSLGKRVREAHKLGFLEVFVPEGAPLEAPDGLMLRRVRTLAQVSDMVFEG